MILESILAGTFAFLAGAGKLTRRLASNEAIWMMSRRQGLDNFEADFDRVSRTGISAWLATAIHISPIMLSFALMAGLLLLKSAELNTVDITTLLVILLAGCVVAIANWPTSRLQARLSLILLMDRRTNGKLGESMFGKPLGDTRDKELSSAQGPAVILLGAMLVEQHDETWTLLLTFFAAFFILWSVIMGGVMSRRLAKTDLVISAVGERALMRWRRSADSADLWQAQPFPHK